MIDAVAGRVDQTLIRRARQAAVVSTLFALAGLLALVALQVWLLRGAP
ncbi:MAG TPA: hypothetical protein VNC50_11730 [Planctomycetia bacterium]|nr:hypothetical protein [Planctomycetia bacterium]